MSGKEICPRDCPRRSGSCHNEETCERWHEHMERVRAQRENREKDAEIDRRFPHREKGQAAQNNERAGKATKWSVRILHTAAGARI